MSAVRTLPVPPGSRPRSTPVRLRVFAVALVLLVVLAGLVAGLATSNRQSATTAAAQQAEPLLVSAQTINTSLSDADSTAAASFLRGRLEPAALRDRYAADVDQASTALATAAQEAGTDPAVTSSLAAVSTEVPVYTGLVQTALFNERQAYYPLAASYLGEANNLMRTRILPAATQLYATERARLAADEGNAVNPWLAAAAGLSVAVLLVLLVGAQWWMSRHFRRTLNVPLVTATVLIAALGLWFAIALVAQGSGVTTATSRGSGPIDTYTQARILALEMRADDELTLLTLDSVPTYQQDYTAAADRLEALLASSGAVAGAERPQAAHARAAFAAYTRVHHHIRSLDSGGNLDGADAVASGPAATDLPAVSSDLDTVLTDDISGSQGTFHSAMAAATGDLDGVLVAIALLALISAVLVLVGFQSRIAEYR
ncbi:MAG: hypothetical protein ACLPVF_14460 [Acidimicrobiales bacterium]